MRSFAIACTLILAAAVPAAAADAAVEARERAVVSAFVDNYARPAYARLVETTGGLQAATVRYCATPGGPTRGALDRAFADIVVAWAHVDFLRLGPATQNGRLERFSFWPDPRGFVERQLRPLLAGPEGETLDVAGLAGRSAAIQGLPAFERLLMMGDAKPDAEDFSRRCRLAGLVAANLETIAGQLDAGWRAPDGIAHLLTTPGPDNPTYRSPAEAATEVLKALVLGIEQTRDLGISPGLGSAPDKAKPTRFPYARSDLTATYLAASVNAVGELVVASGFADDLPEEDKWAKDSILFELRNAAKTLASLPADPKELVEGAPRGKLEYVRIALASVRETMGTTIAYALGLKVGFNALDGD